LEVCQADEFGAAVLTKYFFQVANVFAPLGLIWYSVRLLRLFPFPGLGAYSRKAVLDILMPRFSSTMWISGLWFEPVGGFIRPPVRRALAVPAYRDMSIGRAASGETAVVPINTVRHRVSETPDTADSQMGGSDGE
jgi:hypothetical protein